MRQCPDCHEVKPLDDFPRNKSGRQGRGAYCKPCHNQRTRDTRERLYGGSREYHLRRRYGIGQKHVDEMLAWQDGKCAVCGKPDPEHVDHDHETGDIRGMLCFNCNQALGNVRDDPKILRRLHNYLILGKQMKLEDHLRLCAAQHSGRISVHLNLLPIDITIDTAGFHHVRG